MVHPAVVAQHALADATSWATAAVNLHLCVHTRRPAARLPVHFTQHSTLLICAWLCPAGTIRLDLVSSTNSIACRSALLPRCLHSFTITVAGDCSGSITPTVTASDRVYITAIWSTNEAKTHSRMSQCPTTVTTFTAGTAATQIDDALERHIYKSASALKRTLALSWDGTNSALTIQDTTSGTCDYKYAVTQVRPGPAPHGHASVLPALQPQALALAAQCSQAEASAKPGRLPCCGSFQSAGC